MASSSSASTKKPKPTTTVSFVDESPMVYFPSNKKIALNLSEKFIDGLPKLPSHPREFQTKFPKQKFILRSSMIQLWNSFVMAQEDYSSNKNNVDVDQILFGPKGVGKSYDCYFLACMAQRSGWIIQYVNCEDWLNEIDLGAQAAYYLDIFCKLNQHLVGDEYVGPLITQAQETLTFYNENVNKMIVSDEDERVANRAVNAVIKYQYSLEKSLVACTSLPYLRILDQHNALLHEKRGANDADDNINKFYADRYKTVSQFKGPRTISLFGESRHSRYITDLGRDNLKLYPEGRITEDEFSLVMDLLEDTHAMKIHMELVKLYTGMVLREIGLFETALSSSKTWEQGLKKFIDGRTRSFNAENNLLIKTFEDTNEYAEAITCLMLGKFGRFDGLDFNYGFVDHGLLITLTNEQGANVYEFVSPIAQNVLLASLKRLRWIPPKESAIIQHSTDPDGPLGDAFEMAFWCRVFYQGSVRFNACKVDGKPDGEVFINVNNYRTLQSGEHVPQECQPGLYRGYPNYPYFDFISNGGQDGPFVFIQTSITSVQKRCGEDGVNNKFFKAFDVRNESLWGKYQNRVRNQVEAILDKCTGNNGHSATLVPVKSNGGDDLSNKQFKIDIKNATGTKLNNVHFVYVTPNGERPKSESVCTKRWVDLKVVFPDALKDLLGDVLEYLNQRM